MCVFVLYWEPSLGSIPFSKLVTINHWPFEEHLDKWILIYKHNHLLVFAVVRTLYTCVLVCVYKIIICQKSKKKSREPMVASY